MNIPRCAAFFCALLPACTVFAAERPAAAHAEAATPLPSFVATLDFDAVSTLPLHVADRRPSSSGVAPSLPDVPDAPLPGTQLPFYLLPFYLFQRGAVSAEAPAPKDRAAFEQPVFDAPEVSLLDASPLGGAARRIGAQKFNTDDGSMLENFAICYRVSKRSSVQVVPGDPAPVKLPVATMQNNMGVTVGMVVRLSRQR